MQFCGCFQRGKVNNLLLQKLSSSIAHFELPPSMAEFISSCVSTSVRRAIAETMSGFSPHTSGALVHTASSIPEQTHEVQAVSFPCDMLTTVPSATLDAKVSNKAKSVYEVWSPEEFSDNQGDTGKLKMRKGVQIFLPVLYTHCVFVMSD